MCERKKWCVLIGLIGWLAVTFLTIRPASAIYLDDAQSILLSAKFYNQVRFRTEKRRNGEAQSWTMMQHRSFVDPQIQIQVLPWLRNVPVLEHAASYLESARFFFNPRFEYEGVYDYGPKTYRQDLLTRLQKPNRFQLFEVYGDFSLMGGRLNIRAGRQNLSWGETDGFRLLDRINPLDGGFGGFQIDLDERRLPLTMLRVTYGLGLDVPEWNLYSTTLEVFVAPDKRLPAFALCERFGPNGRCQPWFNVRAGLTAPSVAPTFFQSLEDNGFTTADLGPGQKDRPDLSIKDSRWGTRLLWTLDDISFSVAYIKTIKDIPTVSLELNSRGQPHVKSRFPDIHIAGFTASGPVSTFQVPVLRDLTYTIFRTEIAGIFNDPQFIETENWQLGKKIPKRNLITGVIGIDHNQWIRTLNPYNTFSFTSQHFYTNYQGSMKGITAQLHLCDFECRPKNRLLPIDREENLTTFAVSTLYSAAYLFNIAQMQPRFTFFYDWEGAWLFQPTLAFIRDPWRFQLQWNWLEGRVRGIGTQKDQDNFAIRVDYLL